jgi:hypothetical protein
LFKKDFEVIVPELEPHYTTGKYKILSLQAWVTSKSILLASARQRYGGIVDKKQDVNMSLALQTFINIVVDGGPKSFTAEQPSDEASSSSHDADSILGDLESLMRTDHNVCFEN